MSQAAASEIRAERLSRDRILDAALALVDREGLEALSMRRLAQELDVWPMSLYRYFHDKEELVAALAEAAANDINLPARTATWREQMRELLGQARAIFERHPGSLSPHDAGPAAARVRDAGLWVLDRAGFESAAADRAWRALLAYTAGAASFAYGAEEFQDGLDQLLDGLEASYAETRARKRL